MKKREFSIITICMMILSLSLSAFAHGGKTDGRGGHKDNKNKSGLGGYHYHCGGYPAHLHTNGVCPYKSGGSSSSSSSSSSSYSSTPKTVYATSITAKNVPSKINKGETTRLEASVYPSNAEDKTISWESSDASVLIVSNTGTLTAVGIGTATITAKTSRGTSSKFTITVNEVMAESIAIKNKTTEILTDDCVELNVVFAPENTSDKSIEWASSNEDVATVSKNGTLKAIGVGVATITATHKGFSDSFILEVKPIKADKIEIEYLMDTENEYTTPRVKKGETIQLTAVITPDNTTDKTIKWSVDDDSIAKIDDNGNLTALATGTVTVTATTSNGKMSEIEIDLYSNTSTGIAGVGGIAVIAIGLTYFLKRKKSKNAE